METLHSFEMRSNSHKITKCLIRTSHNYYCKGLTKLGPFINQHRLLKVARCSRFWLTILTHSIRGRRIAWLPDSPITHAGVPGVASSRATTASTPNLLLYTNRYTDRGIHCHQHNQFQLSTQFYTIFDMLMFRIHFLQDFCFY